MLFYLKKGGECKAKKLAKDSFSVEIYSFGDSSLAVSEAVNGDADARDLFLVNIKNERVKKIAGSSH